MHHHMHALTCFHRRLAAEALSDLAGFASPWIPAPARNRLRRSGRRRRLYTPLRTFWNFLAQVLTPGQPCRAAVRQLQAARRRRGQKATSSATGG